MAQRFDDLLGAGAGLRMKTSAPRSSESFLSLGDT
jgi:hypothetical protein